MGFLDKIKTSIGLKSEHENEIHHSVKDFNEGHVLNKDGSLDNKNQMNPPQELKLDLNTSKDDINSKIQHMTSVDEKTSTPQIDTVMDSMTTPDFDTSDISMNSKEMNSSQDIVSETSETNLILDKSTTDKLESIKLEKQRISGQLETLTAEIDDIIKNLESELKNDTGEDLQNISNNVNEKDINDMPDAMGQAETCSSCSDCDGCDTSNNMVDKSVIDKDNTQKKQSKNNSHVVKIIKKTDKNEELTAVDKDTEDSKLTTTDKDLDLSELEDFLSKEKIKDIPTKKKPSKKKK